VRALARSCVPRSDAAIARIGDPTYTAPDVVATVVAVERTHGRATLAKCRGSTAMSLTIAAVGAVAAALFDTSIAPYLRIGGAQPDLVLVFAVIWTVVVGFEGGVIWAFVGGLFIDLLAPRPLGSTAFALLLTVGVAAIIGRIMVRGRYARPIIAVFVCSLMYSTLYLFLTRALKGPIPLDEGLAAIVPTATLDTIIALLIAPIIVRLHERSAQRERVDW
jgi:rod shape-determining protein MreD